MLDTPLSSRVAIFRRTREDIAREFGLDDTDDAVIDTAEGETDLADYLASLVRHARIAEAQAKGIGELAKQMMERKARLDAKGQRLRAIVLHAMIDAGLPKLTAPDFSVARGFSQSAVVIPDDTLVPDRMCRIKREPDKVAIKAELKSGASFDFAHLSNAAETLTVRSA